ncbi:bifunctional protein-serine/threonine kinase/phosphatase [Acidocella sp. KAb 2-4]|uniref:bifunctional protein-serine/threonine kinase/phosphatase n=1 Tax=Acidocella sp. KAb 2-4 TaxID=2885158 RepID=UPI001D07A87F|nr:serine/threonine-protein kinase [Acidocella sp. KAb 2-4]MCB5945267.1 serine/threonine protein kinase [Acidocella sp. KAb 2-4]
MADTAPLACGAWRVATAFAAQAGSSASHNFFAVYTGDSFGAPERGVVGVMARAHAELPHGATGARDAAQLAVHEFAEGYFGARRTLSARRAAARALAALNRWLSGQMRGDVSRHLAPVSLSAVLLERRRIGLMQIGTCQIYRLRGRVLLPLMRPQGRLSPTLPARALGLNDDLTVEHIEVQAEPGDMYLLLGGVEAAGPEALYTVYTVLAKLMAQRAGEDDAALADAALAALAPLPGADKAVLSLRVMAVPDEDRGEALADLPLRPPPHEGDVWDDFIIGRTLFRGRYTILKEAYDTIGEREVALKIPLPAMLQDEVFAAGFMREAWIGTAVRGNNVVRYLDVPPERRTSLYLVMPLYRGETLEKRLNRPPPVELPEGMGIALKLCEAVQDLAAIQIIHRDLKPENVMLLEGGELRLLDLGMAYLPGIDAEEAVKPGGTIRYMAPELLQHAPASGRTEVYALGVTIYRMFSGGPFPFGQPERLPLARLRPDLPRWLGLVLQRALSPRPEDRYADAGALARALRDGLAHGEEGIQKRRWRVPNGEVYLWRALALLLGAGFVYLLARGSR